jgi:hypothetical protein
LRTFKAILLVIGLGVGFGSGAQSVGTNYQTEIDEAYAKILMTDFGRAVCRQILGANAEAISFHLGVSAPAAERMAHLCLYAKPNPWIMATQTADIRKLTLKTAKLRKYKVLVSQVNFPVESWTDPFTNTTVIVTTSLPIRPERWIQILAHEMAVYFDSKVYPSHPDAAQIPELRSLSVKWEGPLSPIVALSNPLNGHVLTFLRALQVETLILNELIRRGQIEAGGLLSDVQERFVATSCAHECIKSLIFRLRNDLMPLGLPILAYSPYYRSLILSEIPKLSLDWQLMTRQRAQLVLNNLPVEFLKNQSGGDPVADMKRVFYLNSIDYQNVVEVTQLLQNDLWPLEKESLFSARLEGSDKTLLEYMKMPLLSGYNVGLSSGPRVRIRGGGSE